MAAVANVVSRHISSVHTYTTRTAAREATWRQGLLIEPGQMCRVSAISFLSSVFLFPALSRHDRLKGCYRLLVASIRPRVKKLRYSRNATGMTGSFLHENDPVVYGPTSSMA